MTLANRVPGRARLVSGRLWSIDVLFDDDTGSTRFNLFATRRRWLRRTLGRSIPAPTWRDIDRTLADQACARRGARPSAPPAEGMQFDVVFVKDPSDYMAYAETPNTLTVSLPSAEVGDMRRALEGLAAGLDRLQGAAIVAALIARIDKAPTVNITLPVDHTLSALQSLLEDTGRRMRLSDDSAQALLNLRRHIDLARPVSGPWPRVRDTLQTALGEALSLPGAEGLAARDDLIEIISRFVGTHRTATAADDLDQCQLQAERR